MKFKKKILFIFAFLLITSAIYIYNQPPSFLGWNRYVNGWHDFVVYYPPNMILIPEQDIYTQAWDIGRCKLEVSLDAIHIYGAEDMSIRHVSYNGLTWNKVEYVTAKGNWMYEDKWKYWETKQGEFYISFSQLQSYGYEDCEKILPSFMVKVETNPQAEEDRQIKELAEEFLRQHYPQAELTGGKSYFDPLYTTKMGYEKEAVVLLRNVPAMKYLFLGKKNGVWHIRQGY